MNSIVLSPSVSSMPSSSILSLETLAARPANDTRITRPEPRKEDLVTRAYKLFGSRVRAAAANYVRKPDVEDLVQDVFVAAARQPAKLVALDGRTLSWLIGVAKRISPSYAARVGAVPLDDLLLREAGDDLEGAAIHAPPPIRQGRRAHANE